jgi:hypothetical protein
LTNPDSHSSILGMSPQFSLFLRKDTYERFQKIKLLHGHVSSVFLVQRAPNRPTPKRHKYPCPTTVKFGHEVSASNPKISMKSTAIIK